MAIRAPEATLRVRVRPPFGTCGKSGRCSAAPARSTSRWMSPTALSGSASLNPWFAGSLPTGQARAWLRRIFSPKLSNPRPYSQRNRPPGTTALAEDSPGSTHRAVGLGRFHVPAPPLCPVRSPKNLGGAGSATQVGERSRNCDSTLGDLDPGVSQGLEKCKHWARTLQNWAGSTRGAHAGVEIRGCGEIWWTNAASQDGSSAVSWKDLRTRQAPL